MMLCEKCQNLSFRDSATATGYARERDFTGAHRVEGGWLPGNSREALESWCAKNCKPAKPVKVISAPTPEKTFTPTTDKVKIVGSNKDPVSKDDKKD
jgi:hypothetical protein